MRDAGHRTTDIGQRTSDGEKSKNNISTPQGGGHKKLLSFIVKSENIYKECFSLKCAQDSTAQVIDQSTMINLINV